MQCDKIHQELRSLDSSSWCNSRRTFCFIFCSFLLSGDLVCIAGNSRGDCSLMLWGTVKLLKFEIIAVGVQVQSTFSRFRRGKMGGTAASASTMMDSSMTVILSSALKN